MKTDMWLVIQGEIFAVAWYATRSPLMLGLSAFFIAAAVLAKVARLGGDGTGG